MAMMSDTWDGNCGAGVQQQLRNARKHIYGAAHGAMLAEAWNSAGRDVSGARRHTSGRLNKAQRVEGKKEINLETACHCGERSACAGGAGTAATTHTWYVSGTAVRGRPRTAVEQNPGNHHESGGQHERHDCIYVPDTLGSNVGGRVEARNGASVGSVEHRAHYVVGRRWVKVVVCEGIAAQRVIGQGARDDAW